MSGPPPAVAACRVAVRRWLAAAAPPTGATVLVACSGGADSLALLAATGFVAPGRGLTPGAVVVDHGLQEGSDRVADAVAGTARSLLGPAAAVEVVRVQVDRPGAGPEGAAREARYAALAASAARLGAAAVLVGHTRDDQAEQVLLGLARGSGARALAGMAPARALTGEGEAAQGAAAPAAGHPVLGRPFLEVTRAQTRTACTELGLVPWQDPHNEDRRFARVRVRGALADLEADLGPGLARNLARTATLLRDDVEALDAATDTAYRELGQPPWPVEQVGERPRAVRTRLWRRLALAAGSPPTDLTSEHLLAVDALLTAWRGQGPLPLPGGVRARRQGDRVWLEGPT